MSELILASASPRRADLLRTLGVEFEVAAVDIDESVLDGEAPVDYVGRLARHKALVARQQTSRSQVILAADTTVSLGQDIFGKPRDKAHAVAMLMRLSNGWHEVLSGIAVCTADDQLTVETVTTRVHFVSLTRASLERYWDTGEPADKAGAYGIQGLGGAFVDRIEGSYSNVVGLPLAQTRRMLGDAGISGLLDRV